MVNVIDKIGLPAVLEQTAEECAELTHVCLKLARKLRGENYTPATLETIVSNLNEEIADVLVCVNTLVDSELLESMDTIEAIFEEKTKRWANRIAIDDSYNEDDLK